MVTLSAITFTHIGMSRLSRTAPVERTYRTGLPPTVSADQPAPVSPTETFLSVTPVCFQPVVEASGKPAGLGPGRGLALGVTVAVGLALGGVGAVGVRASIFFSSRSKRHAS